LHQELGIRGQKTLQKLKKTLSADRVFVADSQRPHSTLLFSAQLSSLRFFRRKGAGMDDFLARREPEILEPESEFGRLGLVRTYGPGAELLQQGTPTDDVYLIREGVVKLVWADSKGRQTIVGLRFTGSFLGTSAVITSDVCPTGVVTVTRCVTERVSAGRFLDRLHEDPELAWKVHQLHSRELYEQLNWLGELACCPARSRVANLLRRLAVSSEPNGGFNDARVHLPLKRKEIAELIAITPEHLSRLLHEFSKEGYIDIRDGWIVVPDPEALATI